MSHWVDLIAKVVDNNNNNVFVRDGFCSRSTCIQVDKGFKIKSLPILRETNGKIYLFILTKNGKNICRHKNQSKI